MHPTVKTWLDKSREELDEIYRSAEPGEIPEGEMHGTAIMAGSFATSVATLARIFAWQGKVFELAPDRQSGTLLNKTTPFGVRLVAAKVYRDKSWLDGKDTIVIDYSQTSTVAKSIRDEIREIEPGVYLGKVWMGRKRVLDFALTREKP